MNFIRRKFTVRLFVGKLQLPQHNFWTHNAPDFELTYIEH